MTIFDESEEAESLIKLLRNSGEVVRDIRVEDAEDMEAALVDNPIDVILAKQKLPYFSALEALGVLAKSGRDIPLVVITPARQISPVTDELKAGARDVVGMDQPERLLHVVKREVGDLKNRKSLRRAEQMLHESEKRARHLIDSSRDAISYVHDGMHIYANQAYLDMFGYESLEDVEGMPILDMVSKEDHAKLKEFLRNYAKGIGEDDTLDVAVVNTDGETFQTNMEFSRASMEGEACTQIIIRDRTDSKALEQKLNVLSKQDLLTGLYNRTYFLDQVDKMIAQAVEGNTQGALLFIEIDNFETIRNTIGITSADKFLGNLARLFKDKLGKHGILARFEGAMFTLLVNNTDMDRAEKIAAAIVTLINDYRTTIDNKVVTATVSIGLTHINETVSDLQDCINRAEKGVEIAHKEGGNRYYIYNPAMEDLAEEQQISVWARRIKEALRNNRFQLLYQPIVSLHGIQGGNYEVLVRMLDESGNPVSPGEFIPAADKADLTKFIDRWIIANTFQALQERVSAGEDIRFFIKISRGTLLDAEFMPWLSERLKTLNLDTSKLVFELDETTALNHLAQAKVLVRDFKQLQCHTALENFGLEKNTFQSLRELPVDFIKIHAKLVANLPKSMENQEQVKAIANEARSHNMQTIAAFVEDASSLAVLWQCSVDFIQGHFLQEPTPELNFEFENAF
ncbi:MAG TPA: GGDEF domain-containing response regulator [Chromatiales bacterium]|nr:GGDEF domain-containing response regulator [Chromatiales bacterium]